MSNAPEMLEVVLDYYNKKEKKLFTKNPYLAFGTAGKVTAFKKHGKISKGDFLNYFLIHRSEHLIFKTYQARNSMLATAITMLEHIMITTGSIKWSRGSKGLQEQVGEAVSLSVISSMFNLTGADWTTIPIMKISGFDFERTLTGFTTGNNVIQVEAKGSFVHDNTKSQNSIRQHILKIRKKKKSINKAGSAYPYPAAIRLGVIASIDPTRNARCLLVDPEGDEIEGERDRLKIASRLEHLALIIWLLAPTAKLPQALIERASAWRARDRLPPEGGLTSSNGYAFTASKYVEDYLAKAKVWLKDQDIVGHLFQIDSKRQLFLGVQGEVIRVAIEQDVKTMLEQTFEASSTTMMINATPVEVGVENLGETFTNSSFKVTLHRASSGVVIGLPYIDRRDCLPT